MTNDKSQKQTRRLYANRRAVASEEAEVARKQWTEPALTVFGTIAAITRGCTEKAHGPSDAIALKAPSIQCAS